MCDIREPLDGTKVMEFGGARGGTREEDELGVL